MPATVNLVLNPSLEEDLSGCVAVGDGTIERTGIDPYVGMYCLSATTTGEAGEGFRLSDLTPQTSGTHTGSVYLRGAGAVTLRLVTNPGGTIRGSTSITLTSTWTRYSVSGVVGTGETVYLSVTASSATIVDVVADAFQIEEGAAPTDYCDGDQYGCYWLGTPHASLSVREVPHPVVAAGLSRSIGTLGMYASGPVLMSAHGSSASSGTLTTATADPTGAVDDFAIFNSNEPDPIYGYALKGTEGIQSGAFGADWVRVYTHFMVPRTYNASDSDIGIRAAYAEVGLRFDDVPAGDIQYVDKVQVEINDIMSGTPPTEYVPPRQVQVIIKPLRINLCKNPSFTLDTALWTEHGDVDLTRDTTKGAETTSPASAKMTVTGTSDDTYIEHEFEALIPGHTYTVSAYATWEEGINDVAFHVVGAAGAASAIMFLTDGEVMPYGAGEYGDGEFGGGPDADVPPPSDWVRVYFQFVATYSNDVLRIYPQADDATGVGKSAWVDHILIEDSATLPPGDYFDGSYGEDYLWETGGDPHLSASYYYPDILDKVEVIEKLIPEHIPLGISMAPVKYAVPYIQ